jgi:hypothetical protein
VLPKSLKFSHEEPISPAVTATLNTALELAAIADVEHETVES